MPKRTNEFQTLIALIYKHLKKHRASGAIEITESAELVDDTGVKREIDVLIESTTLGHSFKIAIECRAHKRKATKEWIDSLIGKYAQLKDVDKKIAVSKSGFSKTAMQSAEVHNIVPLTLKEAKKAKWGEILLSLYESELVNIKVELSPNINRELATGEFFEIQVVNQDGEEVGFLANFLQEIFYARLLNMASIAIKSNMDDSLSREESLTLEKGIFSDIRIFFPGLPDKYTALIDDNSYEIVWVSYSVKSLFKIEKLNMEHFTYNQDTVQIAIAKNDKMTITVIESENDTQK